VAKAISFSAIYPSAEADGNRYPITPYIIKRYIFRIMRSLYMLKCILKLPIPPLLPNVKIELKVLSAPLQRADIPPKPLYIADFRIVKIS
jgi:hypothetical protein